MRTTSYNRNGIVYTEKRTCVDIDTGEEIDGCTDWIKNNFKILERTKKTSYGYLTKTTEITWILKRKPTQLKLL